MNMRAGILASTIVMLGALGVAPAGQTPAPAASPGGRAGGGAPAPQGQRLKLKK